VWIDTIAFMPRNHADIAITGVGLISPLGQSAGSTYRALLEGRTLKDRLSEVPDDLDPQTPMGFLKLIQGVGGVAAARRMPLDPAVGLAEIAATEALRDAGLPILETRHMPIILASSKGAVGALCSNDSQIRHEAAALSPHGFLARHVRGRLGGVGVGEDAPVTECVVAACASGLAALDRAQRALMRLPAGRPARVLVVGVESALLPLFLHSYNNLGVLAPLEGKRYVGRPLSARRSGFVLNEIAAAIVLERRERTSERAGGRPGLQLLGVRMANDGTHLVKSDPAQPALRNLAGWALQVLRESGGHSAEHLLLHPHATGTIDHDPNELNALSDACSTNAESTSAYAVKGALGHSLGAAGLVSLVIACMIARHRRLPPMPWLSEDAISTPLRLHVSGREDTWASHAVFAAGFGGHAGCAVIQRTGNT